MLLVFMALEMDPADLEFSEAAKLKQRARPCSHTDFRRPNRAFNSYHYVTCR